jgi:hypothetical protein
MISLPIRVEDADGSAELVFEVVEENERRICWLYHLELHLKLPPKAWLRKVRGELAKLENIAREAGCAEMRIRGRDWSKIIIGFEALDGVPNGLRKVL